MKTTHALTQVIAVGSLLALTACGAPKAVKPEAIEAASLASNQNLLTNRAALTVIDSSNQQIVYSDNNPASSLKLVAGHNYTINIDGAGMPAGTAYSLVSTETDIVGATPHTIPLVAGNNSFSVPQQGDYAWKLMVAVPGFVAASQNYQAAVSCANPTFNVNMLTPGNLSVSAVGSANLYNFSAAGVVANPHNYTCYLDPTGSGIVDTQPQPCDQAFNNIYVNYVQNRHVGLIIKDSCNTTLTISNLLNLPATVPAKGAAIPFIYGVLNNALGTAQSDSRIDGVNYLATNVGGNNIVQSNYASGSFNIYSQLNYGRSSSVNFGMEIKLSGITDTINVASKTGTVDLSNAKISKIQYSTDQAGDQLSTVSLSASSCTLSQQGGKVLFASGTPCSLGQSGTNNMATVEIWGHYDCTISNNTGSSHISGDFDGLSNLVDACIGGGGGGGGGIIPIQL